MDAEGVVGALPHTVEVVPQVEPRDPRVAGVEADAETGAVRFGHRGDDPAQVLERAADRGSGAGGEFEQDARAAVRRLQRLDEPGRVALDAACAVAVGRVARVSDDCVEAEQGRARHLPGETVRRVPPQFRLRAGQVDQVGVVRGDEGAATRGGAVAVDDVVRDRRLGPAVGLLGEDLEDGGADPGSPSGRVVDPASDRYVGAEFVGGCGGVVGCGGHRSP